MDEQNIIPIKSSDDDTLSSQLINLYKTFREVQEKQKVTFDFSNTAWVCPLLTLPIATHINETESIFLSPKQEKMRNYLSMIKFPEGISTISEMKQQKSYIPIGLLRKENSIERDRIETAFLNLVHNIIDPVQGSLDAIYYPITELVLNIFEHSKESIGWVSGQWYPNKKFLDICIVDRGRGFASAYAEDLQKQMSDENAIKAALSGVSIKNEKERGYGMRTSKNVVCKLLGGSFILISGSAALISEQGKEQIIILPGFHWKGAIIAYRIPKPTTKVDISSYVE